MRGQIWAGGCGAVFAALFWGAPVLALTAEEVWLEWQAWASEADVSLRVGDLTREQDTGLILRDVVLERPLGQTRQLEVLWPEIILREGEADRVSLDLGAGGCLRVTREMGGVFYQTHVLMVEGPEAVVVVSGAKGELSYELHARGLAVQLHDYLDLDGNGDEVEIRGEAGPSHLRFSPAQGQAALDLAGLKVAFFTASGAKDSPGRALMEGGLRIGSVQLQIEGGGEDSAVRADLADLRLTAEVHGGGRGGDLDVSLAQATLLGEPRAGGEAVDLDLSTAALQWRARQGAAPPVELGLASARARWALAPRQSVGAREFDLDLQVDGVTPTAAFWARLDPKAVEPPVPLEARAQISGRLQRADPAPDVWGLGLLLQRVELAQFFLRGLGVDLRGSGALWADHNGVKLLSFVPFLAGDVQFWLIGVPSLLEKLAAVGFISNEERMALQLGLLMATQAGEKPAERRAKVAFGSEGLLLNGRLVK